MKRILVFLAAAAFLMTACSPDNRTGTNSGIANGGSSMTDGANGTDGANPADNGGADNGGADNGTTGGNADGADRNGTEAGSGSLRRNTRRYTPPTDSDLPSDTLGDRDGDGFIENTVTDGPDNAAGFTSYRRVRSVDSAEDARNFIGAGFSVPAPPPSPR